MYRRIAMGAQVIEFKNVPFGIDDAYGTDKSPWAHLAKVRLAAYIWPENGANA